MQHAGVAANAEGRTDALGWFTQGYGSVSELHTEKIVNQITKGTFSSP